MLICPRCDAANPEGYRFCGQCGAAIDVVICPVCGTPAADAGQRFCGQCGTELHASAGASGSQALEERKLATVLFADVVGFTAMAERTDPEVMARLVDGALGELARVVVDHGGTVDKYLGDALMAVFGVPVAHDDDAERAVAAALSMRTLGGDLVFSIGVNSGSVMVTSLGGADVTVIGDTVNVAARLEAAAGPGEVLCGPLTAQLAGHAVSLVRKPSIMLKGKREPVEVWEAVGFRQTDVDGDPGGPPLVGREAELAFLRAQWETVVSEGQPQVVVVCGDAGSGKSRLASELADWAAMEGQVLRANYPAYGSIGGARLATDVLRQLGPSRDPDVNLRLRSLTGDVDPTLREFDPAALQAEQLWAFAQLLAEKTDGSPLLVVIDDVHRTADRPLGMLAAAARSKVPMLTVLVGRSDPGDWRRYFPDATTVRLSALSRRDATRLAEAFLCDKPLAPEAAEFLVERSGGNPFYLRELVAMGRAQGSLVEDGGSYRLRDDAAIPASMQALLAARLDSMEPTQKLAFEYVAVLGDAPTRYEVEQLGGAGSGAALRALVDSGLLHQRSDGRYAVQDALLREVAYETLPRTLRGELHRRAADLVGRPEERARHLERAAEYLADDRPLVTDAADALADVGEALLADSRHQDAMRVLERAVALGCRRPWALLDLARLQAQTGPEDVARETLALVADDPADPAVMVERDHCLANTRVFSDPGWALPRLQDVARRWEELGNRAKEAWAHANAGVALFNLSHMHESAAELERSLALFDAIGDRQGRVASSVFLCLVLPADERVPGWLAAALEFADEAGDRLKQVSILVNLTWHHFMRSLWGGPDDTAEAEAFALRLVSVAEELGADEMTDMAIQGWSLLALISRGCGRLDEAAERAAAIQLGPGPVRAAAWLGWAATFAVTVARGAHGAAAPFPPHNSPDPIVGMAALVVGTELTLVGRVGEALEHFDGETRPSRTPVDDLAGALNALALTLAGGPVCADAAREWAERGRARRPRRRRSPRRASCARASGRDRRRSGRAPPTTRRGIGYRGSAGAARPCMHGRPRSSHCPAGGGGQVGGARTGSRGGSVGLDDQHRAVGAVSH